MTEQPTEQTPSEEYPRAVTHGRMTGQYLPMGPGGSDLVMQAYFWQKALHSVPELARDIKQILAEQRAIHGNENAVNIPLGIEGSGVVWPDLFAKIDEVLAKWNLNGDGFPMRVVQYLWAGCPAPSAPDPARIDEYAPLLAAPANWPGPPVEIQPIQAFNPTLWPDESAYIEAAIAATRATLEAHCQDVLARFDADPTYQERVKKSKVVDHADWLIRFQLLASDHEGYEEVAEAVGKASDTVTKGIQSMAAAVGIKLREAPAGRRLGSKNNDRSASSIRKSH